MLALHEQYLINDKGQRKAVVVPFNEWEKICEILEEYEDIYAYDKAKAKKSHPIALQKVIKKLRGA